MPGRELPASTEPEIPPVSSDAPDPDAAGRSGTLSLESRTWAWRAWERPTEEGDGAPSPFLDWWEVRFRLEEDSAQEARVRAGVPPGRWSEETVGSILRSARERTWRDADGRLWTVRLEGWTGQGISTDVAEGEEQDGGPTVVFSREEAGEQLRRPARELSSLTGADDDALQSLLEGRDPVPEDD